MELRRRAATEDDFSFLDDLNLATLGPYATQIFGLDEARTRAGFRSDWRPGLFEVVTVDGTDCAAISVEERGDRLVLHTLIVAPSHQRRGIGTALVGATIAHAADRAVPIALSVLRKNPARALYERLGFVVVGCDEHRLQMSWTPSAPRPPQR